MVLGKTLESPLDHKEIKPVNSEGNQLWTVIGRTKAEVPTLWPRELKGLLAQRLKRLSAMQETWVRSLGREDPLEKEMATPCTILAQRIPWTEEPGGLQSTGLQRVGPDWATSLALSLYPFYIQQCAYMEEEMTTHSSILAWKIPWTAEPGRLLSMGLQRVGHDWATSL